MEAQGNPVANRALKAAAYSGIGLGLSALATVGFANHAERDMALGAHQVEVTPSADGHATLEWDGIAKGRIPVDAPFGLGANVRITGTHDINTAIQQDALIATEPQGEIDSLRSAVVDMWFESASKGVLTGTIATMGLALAIGRPRPDSGYSTTQLAGLVAASVGLTVAGYGLVSDGGLVGADNSNKWVPITEKVPILERIDHPVVQAIEVDETSLTDGATKLVNSGVRAYQEAVPFYESLIIAAETVKEQIRQPQEGETIVLQVSDRHDNIPMDAVARAIGDAGGATIVISTGDDTSVGGEWEAFSLNSLNSTFADYKEKIVVPGNHDEGPFVGKYLKELGWHVLNGKTQKIGGILWLGDADPRSSGLGDWVDSKGETIAEQSERLADAACDVNEPLTIATHTTASAKEALVRGCAALAIGGHAHIQKGPDAITGESGHIGVTYTNGSTGGATFTFALADKIKRDAQVALITYKDGEPIGLQPVTITTTGKIVVQPYFEMPHSLLAKGQQPKVATAPKN